MPNVPRSSGRVVKLSAPPRSPRHSARGAVRAAQGDQMARDEMAGRVLDQRRFLLGRGRSGSRLERAPRPESAARRRVEGARMSPSSSTGRRARCSVGSGTTAAKSSACVYGCCGPRKRSLRGASSTSFPRYITATRSQRNSTVARSCVMNRHEKPMLRCRSRRRFRIDAWTETSSADTGSSATRTLGSTLD